MVSVASSFEEISVKWWLFLCNINEDCDWIKAWIDVELQSRLFFSLQPREIKEIKDFLLKARRKDAKCK